MCLLICRHAVAAALARLRCGKCPRMSASFEFRYFPFHVSTIVVVVMPGGMAQRALTRRRRTNSRSMIRRPCASPRYRSSSRPRCNLVQPICSLTISPVPPRLQAWATKFWYGRRHLQGSPSTRGAILTTSAASCRPRSRPSAQSCSIAGARRWGLTGPLRTVLLGPICYSPAEAGIRDGMERCAYRGPLCTRDEYSSSRCFYRRKRSVPCAASAPRARGIKPRPCRPRAGRRRKRWPDWLGFPRPPKVL